MEKFGYLGMISLSSNWLQRSVAESSEVDYKTLAKVSEKGPSVIFANDPIRRRAVQDVGGGSRLLDHYCDWVKELSARTGG